MTLCSLPSVRRCPVQERVNVQRAHRGPAGPQRGPAGGARAQAVPGAHADQIPALLAEQVSYEVLFLCRGINAYLTRRTFLQSEQECCVYYANAFVCYEHEYAMRVGRTCDSGNQRILYLIYFDMSFYITAPWIELWLSQNAINYTYIIFIPIPIFLSHLDLYSPLDGCYSSCWFFPRCSWPSPWASPWSARPQTTRSRFFSTPDSTLMPRSSSCKCPHFVTFLGAYKSCLKVPKIYPKVLSSQTRQRRHDITTYDREKNDSHLW